MNGWSWRIRMALGGAMLGACLSHIITGAENGWWCLAGFCLVLPYASWIDRQQLSSEINGQRHPNDN